VQTLGGFAQTVLTPSTTAGTALVSAMVGGARGTVEVEFVAGPGSASPGSRMVELSAGELAYSPDRRVFVAGPDACLRYETIEIRADAMEYDVMMNVVRAQGSVALKSGAAELTADALWYELSSLRGRLLKVGDDRGKNAPPTGGEDGGENAPPTGGEAADESAEEAGGREEGTGENLTPVVIDPAPRGPSPLSARGEEKGGEVQLTAGAPEGASAAPPAAGPVRLLVEGEKLQTRADPSEDPGLWHRGAPDVTRTWVKARTAVIHPRERVILDHAAIYVDDLRVMGMRRHVLDPRRGGSSLFGGTFGYSSLLGAGLDFPFYYRASASQVGVLHLTHNRRVGGLGGDAGWALGLKEEYIREGRSEGAVSLDDLLHPDRGMEWRHQLTLGGGSALSLSAGTSRYEEEGPSLRAAGLTYFRPLSSGRLSLNLSGSHFGSSEHLFGGLAYRFKTSRLGSGALVTPVVALRHSRRHSETAQVLVDPDTGETLEIAQESSGRTTSPGFDLDVSLPRYLVSRDTQLNVSLHTGYAWGLEGGGRGIFDARLNLLRQLARGDHLRLDYSYSGAPASLQPTPFAVGRQRLSLNGRVHHSSFDVRFSASKEIGGDRLFGHVTATRDLPWGRDREGRALWTLAASHVFSHLSSAIGVGDSAETVEYKIASSRLSLARRLGQYKLAICFSPQGRGGFESQPWISLDGYGYTYSGGRHFWIELVSAGF
jgi:hypothetical protein